MARTTSARGKCYICKKELGKVSMKNHLLKCNKLIEGKTNYFMIKVEGFYAKDYWLYIQIKENSTLEVLDTFLRNIWLECCGHLSSFKIGEIFYESSMDMNDEFYTFNETMPMSEAKLKKVLSVGLVFRHDYDFGSTTILKLTVVDKYSGNTTKKDITLLARNNAPEYVCEKCGEKASYVVMENEWDLWRPLCEKCAEDDEEFDEFYVVNITNSPRMGVCGYDGENDIYELE